MSAADLYEPDPVGDGDVVFDQVLMDLHDRMRMGYRKYQTLLKTHNGRDPLWDAYQEALDLAMYLRQAIMERDDEKNTIDTGR